jgi:hypothetical protein
MTFFSKFKKTPYDFSTTIHPNVRNVTDLTTRVTMNVESAKTVRVVFDPYIIGDLDKPETISYVLYGTPYYHWTILYVNNITNMQTDWPLSAVNFSEFIKTKYTQEELEEIIHYKTPSGIIGDYDWIYEHYSTNPVPVTRFDYEVEQNERLRQILVISPSYISTWVNQFMSKL